MSYPSKQQIVAVLANDVAAQLTAIVRLATQEGAHTNRPSINTAFEHLGRRMEEFQRCVLAGEITLDVLARVERQLAREASTPGGAK